MPIFCDGPPFRTRIASSTPKRPWRPDYEVNLKVEIEIIALHEKLDAVRTQQFEELLAKQQEQLDLLTRLVAQLDNKTNS